MVALCLAVARGPPLCGGWQAVGRVGVSIGMQRFFEIVSCVGIDNLLCSEVQVLAGEKKNLTSHHEGKK